VSRGRRGEAGREPDFKFKDGADKGMTLENPFFVVKE